MYEALIIGLKEGLKIGVVWGVFYSYLLLNGRRQFMRPYYAGIVCSFFLSALSLVLPSGFFVRESLGNIIAMSFTVFLIVSAASLLHLSGVNLFGGKELHPSLKSAPVVSAVILLATALFFAPDILGSTYFLRDLALIKDSPVLPYISAAAGMLAGVGITAAVALLCKPLWIGEYFHIPQLLLFFAMVKLLGSGIRGIAELSLIPSVQRGFMKFIHDFIHQTFVFLMVPDHPLLKTTVWKFIAFFFGPNFASAASLFILLFFPLMFIYRSVSEPVPEPQARTGAEKRRIRAEIISGRRKRSLPVLVFIVLIIAGWFSQTSESVARLFVPKPRPVVVDRGTVTIPLSDPTMNLRDGSLHTFSLIHEGEELRVLVIRRSDNSLAVCLDACEICPPEGYGQREDHVVCIYCGTPIHIDTLGQPGGCNPIPLTSSVDENLIRIEFSEILRKWGFIRSGIDAGGAQ